MVSEKLDAPWQADASQFAGILSVTVREEGSAYAAHLAMVTAEGDHGLQRRNDVESCSDVVKAMAFSAADAIQIVWKLPPKGPDPKPPPVVTPHPAPPRALEPHFEAGVEGGREWGIGSSGAWGGAAFVGYRWPVSRWSARVGAGYWDTGWRVHDGIRVGMNLAVVNADLCPYEVGLGLGISLPLCVRGEMGVHSIHGQSLPARAPMSTSGPWFSLGVLPRLRVVHRGLLVEGTAGLSIPFARADVHSVLEEDDPEPVLVYETSFWAAVLSLGVGWEFL